MFRCFGQGMVEVSYFCLHQTFSLKPLLKFICRSVLVTLPYLFPQTFFNHLLLSASLTLPPSRQTPIVSLFPPFHTLHFSQRSNFSKPPSPWAFSLQINQIRGQKSSMKSCAKHVHLLSILALQLPRCQFCHQHYHSPSPQQQLSYHPSKYPRYASRQDLIERKIWQSSGTSVQFDVQNEKWKILTEGEKCVQRIKNEYMCLNLLFAST